MHFYTAFSFLTLPAIVSGVAVPGAYNAQPAERATTINTVHLVFVQGSDSYNLMIPADGRQYYTGKHALISCSQDPRKENVVS